MSGKSNNVKTGRGIMTKKEIRYVIKGGKKIAQEYVIDTITGEVLDVIELGVIAGGIVESLF